MSFQRDLTGSSNLYANIILNTNICASSVSTINLSATNASFTNITTNTWTTGNVSTPNVIATNGYFSNLYISTQSASTLNTSTLNICNLYASNSSITNLSTSYINTSTITAYITNQSTANVCLVATSNVYSSYNFLDNASISILNSSQAYISNLSGTYASFVNVSMRTITGVSELRVQNNGGMTIVDRDSSDPAVLTFNYTSYVSSLNTELTGLTIETNKGYGKIAAGLNCSLQFYADSVIQAENTSTTGWNLYSSLNSSYKVNFSNLSVSTLSASSFAVTNLSVSSVSAFSVSVASVCASYAYISYIAALSTFYNLSRDAFGDLYVVSQTYNTSYKTKPAIQSDGTNASYFVYSFDQGTYTPMSIGVSGVSVSNLQVLYNISAETINVCDIYPNHVYGINGVYGETLFTRDNVTFLKSNNTTLLDSIQVVNQSTKPKSVHQGWLIDQYEFNVSDGSTALFFDKNNICALNSCLYVSNISTKGISSTTMKSTSVTFDYASSIEFDVRTDTGSAVAGTLYEFDNHLTLQSNVTNTSGIYINIGSAPVIEITSTSINLAKTLYASAIYPFYVSNGNFSNLNVSNFSPGTINTTTINATTGNISNIYTSNIYGVSYISGQGVLNIRNDGVVIRDKNTSGTAYLALNYDSSTYGGEIYGLILEADQTDGAVISAGYQLPLTITLDGVSQLYNTCAGGFVFYNSLNTSFTANISRINNTSMFVSNLSASNISVPGRISVSNISATSISVTGQINASAIRTTADIIATGTGNVSGYGLYGQTLSTSNVYCSVQVNASQVSCSSISTALIYSSNTSFINMSFGTGTGTTLSASTLNASTFNVSTFAVTNLSLQNLSVTNTMSVSRIATSRINFCVGSTYFGSIEGGSTMPITIDGTNCTTTGFTIGVTPRFWINTSGASCYVSFFCSRGNFSTLNASTLSVSTFSPNTITTTTLTASTINGSTGNFSNIYSTSMFVSNLSCSTLQATGDIEAKSALITNNGIIFKEFNSSSMIPIYANIYETSTSSTSTWNFEGFNVNEILFNVYGTDTLSISENYLSSVNGTLNISNISSKHISSTTASITTITTSTINICNASIINISGTNSIHNIGLISVVSDGIYFKNTFPTLFPPYFQFDYWDTSVSSYDRGITFFSSKARGSFFDGGTLPLVLAMDDTAQATCTSSSGWTFQNVINQSYQTNISKLAVSNMSLSGTANFSTLNVSTLTSTTFNPATITTTTLNASTGNFSTLESTSANISNISISYMSVSYITNTSIKTDNISTTNASITSALTIPNTIDCASVGNALTLHSTTLNTSVTGLRCPNYIDGLDLNSGLFIGYSHTAGFCNVCRPFRGWGGVQSTGYNATTTTNNLAVGGNLTSGDLTLGNTTMTGNISVDTTGDVVFGCDIRSTWNTSNLIQFSTQLGSNYSLTNVVTSGSVSGTNLSRLYYPTPANISLLDMPVGLYLVSIAGSLRGFSGYDAIPSNCYAGICYGTNASFTNANTTRQQVKYIFAPNLYSNASTANVVDMSFTGLINMSVTGQKIGAYIQYQATNLATAGSVQMQITAINVVKIA